MRVRLNAPHLRLLLNRPLLRERHTNSLVFQVSMLCLAQRLYNRTVGHLVRPITSQASELLLEVFCQE